MQVPIKSIKVENRVRQDMGDIGPLMLSMGKYGQLSPIVVTRTHELVAGHRRLMAARELGWHSIGIMYIDQSTEEAKLEIELQENVHRKDFSPEELLEGYRRLDKLRNPTVVQKIARFFGKLFRRIFRRKRRKDEDAVSEPSEDQWQTSPASAEDESSPQQYGI